MPKSYVGVVVKRKGKSRSARMIPSIYVLRKFEPLHNKREEKKKKNEKPKVME